jgi:hypothetical protein
MAVILVKAFSTAVLGIRSYFSAESRVFFLEKESDSIHAMGH